MIATRRPFTLRGLLLQAAAIPLVIPACKTKMPDHGVSWLVEVETNRLHNPVSVDHAATAALRVLREKLSDEGFKPLASRVGENRLHVVLGATSTADMAKARRLLEKPGLVELRHVDGDSEKLLRDGMRPVNGEIKRLVGFQPNGQSTGRLFVVYKAREQGATARNLKNVRVRRGPAGERRGFFTYIDDPDRGGLFDPPPFWWIGVLEDEELRMVVQMTYSSGGGWLTASNMSKQEASALVQLLRNLLESPLRVVDEKTFLSDTHRRLHGQ